MGICLAMDVNILAPTTVNVSLSESLEPVTILVWPTYDERTERGRKALK